MNKGERNEHRLRKQLEKKFRSYYRTFNNKPECKLVLILQLKDTDWLNGLKKQDLIFSACKKLALPENRLKAKGWK
jgi:hypothetical protein